NVSDVSFKLAKVSLLEKGKWPEASKVRTEEFVNAFDYGDPTPRRGDPVACAVEQSAHPFLQQRNLLRIGMKTAAMGRSQPLRLTVLLDNSGSMERDDREASVVAAMKVLASQLGPQDVVTLVSFARTPRLLADRLSGDKAMQLVKLVERTPSEGGTNLEEALRLSHKLAKRQHQAGAQSRIVLITDGVANLGNTVPEELSKQIETMRQQGISFDACGVGAEGLNDDILEALTRKGDGRYYFLNRPEDADTGFAKQLAGALSPAAKNVKIQVVFNPKRVSRYRLLGFEKHRLNKEDFRNDKVDAAEMAAEEAGNAVYQIQVNPAGEGELGDVFVRFLDVSTGKMVERSWPLPYEPQAKPFENAAPSM
ncbi:MAG: YfbK domain-containing protein, partial [Akkermansiaceae bacterium]